LFKAKIHELSDENLEEGNWIRQAQQELLDRNIDPTGAREGKSSAKRPHDDKDSVGEVNLTTKGTTRNTSNKRKRSKTNSDSKVVSAKSEDSTGNKPSASNSNTPKCKTCDGPHATKDCYYTLENPPSWWSGKPEIWRKIIETHQKQD
jgi:hypothetical protein